MHLTSLLKKTGTCLIAGLTFAAVILVLGNGGNIPWLPRAVVFSLAAISLSLAFVFPFIWQFKENKQQVDSDKIYGFLYSFIRYGIAFNMAGFGWKKIWGLQFIVPAEISNKPMNQQSGEWLTWYYFGHSIAFGIIIATIQIAGAYLLMFRRTLLIGTVILFALMFNLTLVNIFYQMNAGALLQSIILTMGLVFLLTLYYKGLIEFFLKAQSNLPSFCPAKNPTKNLVRLSVLILSLLFTIYLKMLHKQ